MTDKADHVVAMVRRWTDAIDADSVDALGYTGMVTAIDLFTARLLTGVATDHAAALRILHKHVEHVMEAIDATDWNDPKRPLPRRLPE